MVSLTNVNKNITALTVKEHKLSYVVRMRETESLKGGGELLSSMPGTTQRKSHVFLWW